MGLSQATAAVDADDRRWHARSCTPCPPSASKRRPPRRRSSSSPPVTDFGPGRSKIFGNTDDSQLKVHNGPHLGRRHRRQRPGVEGAPALRLVGPEPHPDDHDRLQHLGAGRVQPHLHVRSPARRQDRRRRGRRARGQEPQGTRDRRAPGASSARASSPASFSRRPSRPSKPGTAGSDRERPAPTASHHAGALPRPRRRSRPCATIRRRAWH